MCMYIEGGGEAVKTFKEKRVRVRAETPLYLLQGGGTGAVSQKTLSVRLRSIDLFSPISNVEPQKAFKQWNGW